MLEIGRVCMKLRGRDAGSKVVIVDLLKDAVVIEGRGTKKSRCNPRHLFPTDKKADIKKGASHEDDVAKALGEGKAPGKKKKGATLSRAQSAHPNISSVAKQAIERV